MSKKVELHVTEAGHKSPNKWKQGDKIKVHPDIAKVLIENGLASDKEVKPKSQKELDAEAELAAKAAAKYKK